MGRRAAMRNAVAAASTLGVGVATAANAEIQDQMQNQKKQKGTTRRKIIASSQIARAAMA